MDKMRDLDDGKKNDYNAAFLKMLDNFYQDI